MSITQADIKKIAKLSRIALKDDELEAFSGDLDRIFDWIEQLKEVDTSDVAPMAGVGDYSLRMREDEATEGDIRDDVLKNAPNANYGCFLVPKVVE